MRYRLSRTIPGLKRPWSIDPEDVSQPLCGVGLEDGVGVPVCGRAAPPERGEPRTSDGRVTSLVNSTVTSDISTGRPQLEQNRLPGVSGAWQCGQVTWKDYTNP
jgi:hypothetical protein